ncbi:conserved hypothetical protein [Talaromyces stipitatus ATCC 10500]|uniref:DUF6589 domain-containing protein n=1 Tax=Talaromyces stipitatus (strain ATCC 10500 / CBS 375.48 / QM 6759 / NRRL 1006) TaxID=441959 RepID=B8LX13_TALSN|nr:uncharacterized protein TSTA_080010 [Talaromyces stipitatus ATCC 10500]EED24646.1 conserved hypothetical protein [Talaromyces stipitatus ATCC 10500]
MKKKGRKKEPSIGPEEAKVDRDIIDHVFDGHKRFIQYIETYYMFKQAIQYEDVGHIRWLYPCFALLFFGGNEIKYSILSLYITWLTGTNAASKELQDAILANSLVNIRGANDSWYEIDQLNEFLNLEMKRIMISRRTSTQSLEDLFRRTALTASYCIDLQNQIDYLSSRFVSSKHTPKESILDIYRLAIRLQELGSLQHMDSDRDAEFIPKDLIAAAVGNVIGGKVALFN